MRTSIAIMAAAAVGLGGAMIGTPSASANPAAPAPLAQEGTSAGVEFVRYSGRHYRGSHPRRHGHRHSRHRDRGGAAAAGILGFGLGAIAGQALTQPRTQYRTYAGMPAQHVQWCQQRYRSYDMQSDTFLSYDGNRYHCNSPYVAR